MLENRAFRGPPGRDTWFCTLEVQAEDAGTVKPVLSIWQKQDTDHDLFYMMAECAPEEMSRPLRRWIDLAHRLGEMRSG